MDNYTLLLSPDSWVTTVRTLVRLDLVQTNGQKSTERWKKNWAH